MRRVGALAVGVVLLTACGPRAGGAGETAPGDGTSTQDPATDSESDTGARCEPGQTACEGTCVNLVTDMDHCGACGHPCQQTGLVGICWNSECTPRSFCRTVEDGFETCSEICGSYGSECATPKPDNPYWHAGGYDLHFGDASDAEACLQGENGNEVVAAGCDDPINWSRTGGFNDDPAVAASCLCLQP